MRTFFVMTALSAFLLTAPPARAGSPWTEETRYASKAAGKLEFGVLNFVGGWTELFTRPEKYHEEKKNILLGVGHGLVNTVLFTAGGAIHTATFFIPLDVPLPENGLQIE